MARISKYIEQNTNIWKVALYIRLSNEDKDNLVSESVQSQKAMLLNYVNILSNIENYKFYIDDGFSGGNFERPSFKKMIEDITLKNINCVIVKDLSRFGRNYIELSKYIQIMFPTLKIRFISINDNIDSEKGSQEIDTFFIGLTGLMNEEYLKDCSVKSKMSYTIRQNKGLFTSPIAPYGYKRDDNDIHKLVIDENVSHIIKFIFQDYIEKKSFRAVAKDLSFKKELTPSEYKQLQNANYYTNRKTKLKHVWNSDTISTILRNQTYIGNLVQHKREKVSYKTKQIKKLDSSKWRISENTHEPIIEKSIFLTAQNLINSKKVYFTKKTYFNSMNDNYFSGLVYCGKCGSKMTYVNDKNRKYTFYKCKISSLSKSVCNAEIIKTNTLKNIVLSLLNQYLEIACDLNNCINEIENDQKTIFYIKEQNDAKIRLLKKQKDNLYQKYRNCEISISKYKALKLELDNQINIFLTNSIQEKFDTKNNVLLQLAKYKKIEELSCDIVKTFIKTITIFDTINIEIEFTFKDEFLFALELLKKHRIYCNQDK